ncbi:hypothetical protein, partial [Marivivens sp.]|uniref:hypothetical protein n=1 Tax=Marivivens sp. TaxID=1978374 RepID=UPI0025BA9EE3
MDTGHRQRDLFGLTDEDVFFGEAEVAAGLNVDNSLLTERLAYAASKANCKLIFISSTGIYGTEKTKEPYYEYD